MAKTFDICNPFDNAFLETVNYDDAVSINADLVVNTTNESIEESVSKLIDYVEEHFVLPAKISVGDTPGGGI